MIANFTFIDIKADIFLACASLITDVLVMVIILGLLFLSKKAGEGLKNSLFFLLFSVIVVGFFKNTVHEFLATVFSNVGNVLYCSYLFTAKRVANQVLYVVEYVTLVAYPVFVRALGVFFSGVTRVGKTVRNAVRVSDNFRAQSGRAARPSFHFIS